MKKILFLTPTLPYPPVSGGVIKSNKLVEFLSMRYTLSVACFLKNEDPDFQDEFLQQITLHAFHAETLNVPRNIKNLIISNLQGIPLNLYRNKSASFDKKIRQIIHDYDIVFCDHYVMFQYIPKDFKGKIILHQHNCEYLIWLRYANIEKSIFKKLALYNQAMRIRQYETAICRAADRILAAPNDTEELVKIGAQRKKFLETYHLGDDHLLQLDNIPFEETQPILLYIGTLSWEANIDGLLWFYEQIWPLVCRQHPEIQWHIAGKHPDPRLQEMAQQDPRITLAGFVEDLEPYFRQSRVFITPLRFGSGIKVKVVNALYRGIPCVTTSIGTEGLKVNDGEEIFCKDDPQEYTDAIHELLTQKEKWTNMQAKARAVAQQYYTWDYVLENVVKAIEE